MKKLPTTPVVAKYEADGKVIECSFMPTGWFNATSVAQQFGKDVREWMKNKSTQEYIESLHEFLNGGKSHHLESEKSSLSDESNCRKSSQLEIKDLIKTKRGRHQSGTWLHPKLAVAFARWLSPKFAVWCDLQIEQLLQGQHPQHDWDKVRKDLAMENTAMTDAVKWTREEVGKESESYHYSNEFAMLNNILFGSRKIERDSLDKDTLKTLKKMQSRNTYLIAKGVEYKDRKAKLMDEFGQNQIAS